jgi:hypothetical protein
VPRPEMLGSASPGLVCTALSEEEDSSPGVNRLLGKNWRREAGNLLPVPPPVGGWNSAFLPGGSSSGSWDPRPWTPLRGLLASSSQVRRSPSVSVGARLRVAAAAGLSSAPPQPGAPATAEPPPPSP